jgi:hypothetical protein
MIRQIRSWMVGVLVLSIAELPCLAAEKPAVTIEIQSIGKLISDVNCVATGSGFQDQSSNIVNGISGFMNSPKLAGIDTNSPIRIYVFLPETPAGAQNGLPSAGPSAVIVIGLTGDSKTFLDAYAKSYTTSKQLNDITQFSGSTGSGSAFSGDSFVKIIGKQAVLGQKQSQLQVITDTMAKGAITNTALQSVRGAVRLSVDIQACLPLIDGVADTVTQGMGAMPMSPAGSAGIDPRKIAQAEVIMITNLAHQVKTFAMGIGADAKNIEITSYVSGVPGTTLEKVMKKLQPVSDRYLSILPDNSLAYMAANGNQTLDDFIPLCADFISELGEAISPNSTNAAALMKKSLLGLKGVFAGDFASVVIARPDGKGFASEQVKALKDPALMETYMASMIADYNETYGKLSPGITISGKGERKYQGKTIHAYAYAIDKSAPGFTPNPFTSLFTSQTSQWAIVGNDVIEIWGSEAQMNAAIDGVIKGAGGTSKSVLFRQLFPQLTVKPVAVYSISLINTIKAFLAGTGVDAQTLAMIPESKGGVAGYTYKNGDDLACMTRINISEIVAIKDSASTLGMMMMQMMMSGGAGMPPTTGASADPSKKCINNLRIIDAAKEQCALEKNLKDGQAVSTTDISKYLPGGMMPKCPAGGQYTVNPIGKDPTCSHPGHALTGQ